MSYLIDWLKSDGIGAGRIRARAEYRLLCSGAIYNKDVQTLNWRKSTLARLLLEKPFRLIVADWNSIQLQPTVARELSCSFEFSWVEKKWKEITTSFPPDEEIARDIAALLTLLSRRLITSVGPVNLTYLTESPDVPPELRSLPQQICLTSLPPYWGLKTTTRITPGDGQVEDIDYNPVPKGVSESRTQRVFEALALSNQGLRIVLAARLYSNALQMIHQWPDVAYLMLIMAAEVIAAEAERELQIDRERKITAKQGVLDMAKQFGLSKEQAEELAIEATSGFNWHAEKFRRLFNRGLDDGFWRVPDDLFRLDGVSLPDLTNVNEMIDRIYRSRGAFVHQGKQYSPGIMAGLNAMMPTQALMELVSESTEVPPVAWFERAVNHVINKFIDDELLRSAPAVS